MCHNIDDKNTFDKLITHLEFVMGGNKIFLLEIQMTNIIMIKWLKLKFQMEIICDENIDPL